MRFPTHIILDVSRPTVVNSKAKARWQKFYRNRFNKTNSSSNRHHLEILNRIDRILVTKTEAAAVTDNALYIVKHKIIANNIWFQPKKAKYFLPYRFSYSDEKLEFILQSIYRHRKASSLNNTKFDNLVSMNTAATKCKFLSDRVVKDFQLEKELVAQFSSPVFASAKLTSNAKTFNQWKAARTQHVKESRNDHPTLVSTGLRKALEIKSKSLDSLHSFVQNTTKKFCFKSYTVRLKLGQSLNRSWNKRIYSKGLHQPNESRLRSLFNINFLVKEMRYSKLKYSKTAERDIVSSGSAALFAGFIGFLISEKFGIELVDSGDFYFAVMYLVFVGFSLKAFVAGLESHVTDWNPNSDRRAYIHKPAKWVTLLSNSFTYFLTVFHLVLQVPHTILHIILHSIYPLFNFTLAEFLNSINFGYVGYPILKAITYVGCFIFIVITYVGYLILKVIIYVYDFLTSFPYDDSDHKKR